MQNVALMLCVKGVMVGSIYALISLGFNVIFRTTGDKTRDVLRLHRIYGIITSYPGKDRFAFHVFERGRDCTAADDHVRRCAGLVSFGKFRDRKFGVDVELVGFVDEHR